MIELICLLLWLQAIPAPRPVAPQPHPLDEAVRETLQRYEAAYESLDAQQVKKVHPSLDADALRQLFNGFRALEMKIDDVRVLSSEGATVRVSCKITQTYTPKAGKRETSPPVTRVFRLRKQEASWVIDGYER
jgi:hypothetical protein